MDDEKRVHLAHDALFRRALMRLSDARSALSEMLPAELTAALDLERMRPAPPKMTTAVLQGSESDALYVVPIRGEENEALAHLSVEQQSRGDRNMAARALRSQQRIWDYQLANAMPLTPVVACVLSHGARWTAPLSMLDRLDVSPETKALFAPYTPSSVYVLKDLAQLTPEELARRAGLTPLVRATFFLLQRARESEALEAELELIADDLRALSVDVEGGESVLSILTYICGVGSGDPALLRATVRKILREHEEVIVGTYVEQWLAEGEAKGLEKGLEKGIEKGLEKGKVRGRVATLLRQIELKFDLPSETTRRHLEEASEQALDAYTDRILGAASLEELFEPL